MLGQFSTQHQRRLTNLLHTTNTCGRRAFSVAGPMAWNSLPDPGPNEQYRLFQTFTQNVSVSSMLVRPVYQGVVMIKR